MIITKLTYEFYVMRSLVNHHINSYVSNYNDETSNFIVFYTYLEFILIDTETYFSLTAHRSNFYIL